MKTYKHLIALGISIPVILMTLSGCGGKDEELIEKIEDELTDPDPTAAITKQIDATAGGFGAQPDDATNKYTYFSLDTGEVIVLTDTEADSSSDWHIAFKRTKTKLNGGASGSGDVTGAIADSQDDFYNTDGSVNDSVFLNASPESELAALTDATGAGLTFEEEKKTPAIKGDGSSDGWWLYNPQGHAITANSDGWWLVRSAKGDSYAKMHVTNIEQASKEVTLEMFVQNKDDSAFSTTPITWVAAIGADGGNKCYDFDNEGQVDCSGLGAGSWDIMVDITGRDWNIWTNGTVKGFGNGKALGKIENADIDTYVSATMTSAGADISGLYQSASSGLFGDNTWYAYGLQGNHKLWPNYRVYAVDTGTKKYKLQLIGFYNDSAQSGHITLRYQAL